MHLNTIKFKLLAATLAMAAAGLVAACGTSPTEEPPAASEVAPPEVPAPNMEPPAAADEEAVVLSVPDAEERPASASEAPLKVERDEQDAPPTAVLELEPPPADTPQPEQEVNAPPEPDAVEPSPAVPAPPKPSTRARRKAPSSTAPSSPGSSQNKVTTIEDPSKPQVPVMEMDPKATKTVDTTKAIQMPVAETGTKGTMMPVMETETGAMMLVMETETNTTDMGMEIKMPQVPVMETEMVDPSTAALLDDVPRPPIRSEAPYPPGTLPEELVEVWDAVIAAWSKPPPVMTFYQFCSVTGDYRPHWRGNLVGYVQDQLIFNYDHELDDPEATIAAELRAAGWEFERIEVFTAGDYAQYGTKTFLNILASASHDGFDPVAALDEHFSVGIHPLADILREAILGEWGDQLPMNSDISYDSWRAITASYQLGSAAGLRVQDGSVKYQVKIHHDGDGAHERFLEYLHAGDRFPPTTPLPHIAPPPHANVIDFRHTCDPSSYAADYIYYLAGGIHTMFGDDLIWLESPLSRTISLLSDEFGE